MFGFGGAEITDDGFVQFDLQDIAIEKQDGAEGLVLGRSRDFLFDRQVGGELVDFGSAHFARMAFVVEEDVAAHPGDVGLFGTQGIVPQGDATRCLVRRVSLSWSRSFFGGLFCWFISIAFFDM